MTAKRIHTDSLAQSLFTSRARLELLALLFVDPDRRFYLREIGKRTGLPIRAVQVEVARLEASGLLTSTREGNRKYYAANRAAPIFPELRSLLLKTVALGDTLKRGLQDTRAQIVAAFLFGSFARAEQSAASDVDLLVIGSITSRALSRALLSARETLRREINPVLMTEREFKRRLSDGDHFLQSVMSEPKTFLMGGQDDIDRLAEQGRLQPHRTSN
jgi:predicted nucleotidyltransferase